MRIIEQRIIEGNIKFVKIAGKSTETPPTAGICSGSMFVQVDAGIVQMFEETDGEQHNFAVFDTGASASKSVDSVLNSGLRLNSGLNIPHEERTEEQEDPEEQEEPTEPGEGDGE